MALAEKYDKKVEAADLPVKTKDQIRKFLADKEITDTQFKQILERVIKEYLSTRIEPCEAVGVIAAQSIGEPVTDRKKDFNLSCFYIDPFNGGRSANSVVS